MELHLCDVFSECPLGGNSLTVVVHDKPLAADLMQSLTREFRQFETAFVRRDGDGYDVRIFDLNTELAFAGHPLLGAAAVMHRADAPEEPTRRVRFTLPGGPVTMTTRRGDGATLAELDAGPLQLWVPCPIEVSERAAAAFSLERAHLHPELPCTVASTGLRYLLVPLIAGLEGAAVAHPALSELLDDVGAEFAYLLDVQAREGRHWENDGSLEDIATGSAAGVAGAFLVHHGLDEPDAPIILRQGRFVGRPSALHVTVQGPATAPATITIAGPVTLIARGEFEPW